jgi:hypothetical protein
MEDVLKLPILQHMQRNQVKGSKALQMVCTALQCRGKCTFGTVYCRDRTWVCAASASAQLIISAKQPKLTVQYFSFNLQLLYRVVAVRFPVHLQLKRLQEWSSAPGLLRRIHTLGMVMPTHSC